MKRILSLFLCIAISMTMIIVPGVIAMAETVPNYEDYIPGEKPANLIDSQTGSGSRSTMLQYFTQTSTAVVKVSWDSWTHIKSTSQVAYNGTTKVGKAGYYMPGALVYDTIMPRKHNC